MRVKDLFVTDYECQQLPVEKLYTGVNEDKIVAYNNKEDFKRIINAKMEEMEIIKQCAEKDPKIYDDIKDELNKVAIEATKNLEINEDGNNIESPNVEDLGSSLKSIDEDDDIDY